MEQFVKELIDNKLILVFGLLTFLDIFLGCIRAIKEHKWNSTVGINGGLRKVAMIGSLVFLLLADSLLHLNLLWILPKELQKYFPSVGLATLFGILFILYEATSILKNMVLCGLPIPKKLKAKIEELLTNLTAELEEKK